MTAAAAVAVDTILTDVANGDLSPTRALTELCTLGLSPDRVTLEDGVRALLHRDDFLAHLGDPYEYLEVGPRAGLDAWAAAAEQADQEYAAACNSLARRPVRLAVTG
jgi:hypothetical protein